MLLAEKEKALVSAIAVAKKGVIFQKGRTSQVSHAHGAQRNIPSPSLLRSYQAR